MVSFFNKNINIGNITVGEKHPPFIIAEMSGNHNQSLKRALKIIEEAKKCGANAIKLQTYTPDTITLNIKNNEFKIKDKKSLWSGSYLYQLFKKAYTPWEWHLPIMERAKELNMICFSTPFDESAVDFLEKLNVPAYKIASFENNHIPLIKKIAKTKKPIIISTGLAKISEITELVNLIKEAKCKNLILLKCTSNYPALPKDANLKTIPFLKKKFNCQIGLSDHTLGIGVATASVALGASVIEKHFTLKKSDGGVDSAFSLEPHELKNLVIETRKAWEGLGKIFIGPTSNEINSLQFRRSIYVSNDIKKGFKFDKKNISVIRPANGLHPKYYSKIIGKKAKKDLIKGKPLSLKDIEK